jgi:hypothetical protein
MRIFKSEMKAAAKDDTPAASATPQPAPVAPAAVEAAPAAAPVVVDSVPAQQAAEQR